MINLVSQSLYLPCVLYDINKHIRKKHSCVRTGYRAFCTFSKRKKNLILGKNSKSINLHSQISERWLIRFKCIKAKKILPSRWFELWKKFLNGLVSR